MDLSTADIEDNNSIDPASNADVAEALSSLPTSNGVSGSSSGDNKFQSAISAWRNIDFTKLVPELDITASDIVAHQRDALVSRKDLAQKTKDFRKLDDASKLTEFKGLLKAYQTFIDLLTSHGKTTSSAFLQLYSSISEAPDPYPLLEASVDALLVSEDTLPKLTSENEHLQKTVAAITRQLETVEHQIEQERATRRELEAGRDSQIEDVEQSWKAVLEEKQNNWEAKERSLEEKVESQERLLNELKASYEVSQRLGSNAEHDGESRGPSASAAELEMISSDLDRTSQRLAEVEARNEQLRLELAETTSNSQRRPTVEEDPASTRLRSENSSLLRKLEAIKSEKSSETRKQEARIRALERDTQALQSDKESLKARLQERKDYNDIKQELEIFKSIEFATLDDDNVQELPRTDDQHLENGVPKEAQNGTLEQLLLARNKKLSNEMAVLRVSHQDLQQQLGSLQETMSSTNAELERSQNLNATLESDLLKVQQEAPNALPSSAMSTTGGYTSRYPNASIRRGRASPTSSIISGFDPSSGARNTMEAIRMGEPVGGGSGIMPMIQAQRDRFKQKNTQLEEEVSKQHNTISSLRQEIASLQKDNLNLYEKSRYTSTYSRNQPSSSASQYISSPQATSIQVASDTPSGLSLDRYRSTYEANISPFAAFRGRESARAYKRMSLPERVIYTITRMVLANRTSRNLFAGYCLALHFLIFIMLYWLQTTDITKHASNLSDAASAAVAAIGGAPGAADHGDWQQEPFRAES